MRSMGLLRLAGFAVMMGSLMTGCAAFKPVDKKMTVTSAADGSDVMAPPVIRQPVLPELLVGCRGHVLVPALGMLFVHKGDVAPGSGQFLREERLSAPYRIIKPGARLSLEQNPQRLNVELDRAERIIGFYCG